MYGACPNVICYIVGDGVVERFASICLYKLKLLQILLPTVPVALLLPIQMTDKQIVHP